MAFLREQDVLPAALVKPPSAPKAFLRGYRHWLAAERDLSEMTILRYANLARRFLDTTVRPAEVGRGSVHAARERAGEFGFRARTRGRGSFALAPPGRAGSGDFSVVGRRMEGCRPARFTDATEVEKLVGSCDGTRTSDTRDLGKYS